MTTADKMRAAEKLLSRLFERKKSIIEQLKQQTESYNQHLASKFLIEGIDPPSWLPDPSASGSKELNEEEDLKLLRQYPPWSVPRYPGHSNLVVTGDHEKFLDGDFVENLAPNKDLDQNHDPAAPGCSGEDHGGSLLNTVPEIDASAASPEDQTDERISNIYTAPDQSLARIQRSKSRQKALQLRSSTKAPAKSGLRHESSTDVVSSPIRFSPSITNQPGQNNELSTLGEPCIFGSQSCENRNVDEAQCLSREMGVDAHSERLIRSETYAEVPISVAGSIPLGCSSEDSKENTSSQDVRVRRKESMPLSGTEHADSPVNKSPISAGPSAVSCQSFRDRGEENEHCLSREMGVDAHSERLIRSETCAEVPISVVGSIPLGCSSEDYKENTSSQDVRVRRKESMPLSDTDADSPVNNSPKSAGPSAVSCQSFRDGGEENEHCLSREMGVDAHSERLIRSDTCAEVPISVVGSIPLGCSSEDYKENTSSQDVRVRRKESMPISDTEHADSPINKSPKSAGPSAVSCQSFRDRGEENATFLCKDEEKNVYTGEITRSEVSSRRQSCGCDSTKADRSSDDYQGINITVIDSGDDLPPDCVDGSLMKINLSNVRHEGCDAPESVLEDSGRYKDPATKSYDCSVKKTGTNQIAIDEIKQYTGQQSQILSWSIDENCSEHEDSSLGNNSLGRPSTITLDGKNSSLAGRLRHERIESWPQAKRRKMEHQQTHGFATSQSLRVTKPHNFQRDPDIIYPKTMEIDIDTGVVEHVDKSTDDGICSEVSTNLMKGIQSATLSHHGEVGSCYIKKNEHKFTSPVITNEQLVATISSLSMKESRNSQGCFIDGTRTSPSSCKSLDARMSGDKQCSQNLCNLESNADNLSSESLNLSHTLHKEIHQSEVSTNLMEGIQSATLSHHGEVGSCYIKKNEHKFTSPVITNEQLVATISSLSMKESRNSQGCFIEGTRTSPSSCKSLDARMSGDKQCSQNLCNLESNADNLSSESLNLSHTLHKEIHQSLKWEDGLHLQHSVLSSSNEDLQLTDVDQSMPVFERFTVNAQTDTDELDFAADGFDLCELDLPKTTLERASILAEICRSASLDGPSSHFSSAFKFQDTSNLCKSLSDDGHLDHMEFGNEYPLNADLGMRFQSRSSSSDDYTDALDGMPYSVSLAYSGERYGWNLRNQPPSPVGKIWNQLSSHTGSSGKCSSSNPELTCFPIEEDPSSSEENKIMEENAGETLDETDSSLGNHCDKGQPLKDLTNMGTTPMSVSAEVETFRADSVDFLNSKFSVTRTQEKTLLGPKYQLRKRSETSEKQISCTRAADSRKHQISSIGLTAIKRAKESVKDSINKLSVSNKTNLKGQDPKLSLRESRTNNIVSNVRSFIPLIQQKQAATAACTGKRDVKVKALEAAEAAKRLMEKKENERNQRKEALKFERAEKNLKHVELEKKKKEEERKQKNADIAKKRLREDEEKKEKEKEKKRLRLEPRQRQREQEEKKRVERHEKENQRTKNDQLNSKKESKRQQNEETTRGEGVALQKTDTNLTPSEVVANHEECGTSGLSCDGEEMHAGDKSPRSEDLIVQNNQGKSYDISPYQSDDEDEEDDELPIKKYVPSWASKTSVGLFVPLLQELDPDVIFLPDRICSMDDVVRPRKLQQKQVVA